MDALLRTIETVTDWVSGALMAWSIFVLMILVLVEVVMRYLLNQPLSLAEEYGGYLLVAMTMIGLAYTWKEKGHINVDLLISRFSAGVQLRLRFITLLLAAALTALLVVASCSFVSQSFLFGARSGSWLRTPLAWPQLILVLGIGAAGPAALCRNRQAPAGTPDGRRQSLMDPITFLIVIVVVLMLLMFSGLEIAWSVGIVAAAGLIWYTGQPVDQIAAATWSSLNSFTLTAMPLFILMGNILGNSGVHERLFNAIDKWVGHLPGGLVCSVIFGNAIFAAMSGSTIAATATFGKIAFPVMEKRNYDPALSLGAIASASILAPLIPPSILMIIYGAWQGVSIVDLLAAGIIPGLLLTALFILTVVVRVLINPSLAPRQPKPPLSDG